MTPDQIADSLNKTRRKLGEPEIDRAELLELINDAKKDIENDHLEVNEKQALRELHMRELENSIRETPIWIKAVWAIIFIAVIRWLFT